MSTPRFDLVHIIRILQKHVRFIAIITIVTLILGVVFYLIRGKKYESKSEFFVNNPLFGDRSNMFAGADARYTDYFGDEDDIDRVMALAESDTLQMQVIRNAGLDTTYNKDIRDRFGVHLLKERFVENLDIKRTAYKMVEVYYTEEDPFLAAHVADVTVKELEKAYRNFYNSRRINIHLAINNKISELDSTIAVLTDTLAVLREESGIYDLLSPGRENLIIGTVKGNGNNTGRYVEVIQNVEAEKDILVKDRARYISLMQQYATGTGPEEMTLFQIVTAAKPPVDPKGPTLPIILAACFFIGLFFSSVYILITTYYKEAVATRY